MRNIIILSCEHASNHFPAKYQHLIKSDAILQSHRGYDIGAEAVCKGLARALNAKFVLADVSRMLIDFNRSVTNPGFYSAWSKHLSTVEKNDLIAKYYRPYRDKVEQLIRQQLKHYDHVIHLSVHSFTPKLNGKVRTADIGLLYDPQRTQESKFATRLQAIIKSNEPDLRVRRNYPYKGTSDGFTTYLRKVFAVKSYSGIELEINQMLLEKPQSIKEIVQALASSIL